MPSSIPTPTPSIQKLPHSPKTTRKPDPTKPSPTPLETSTSTSGVLPNATHRSTPPSPTPRPSSATSYDDKQIASTQFLKTPGTYQEKTNEKAESINLVGFSSKPRDPIFEFIEDSFIEEENERVSKDLQKLTIVDMTADKQKKQERIKSFSKENKVQVIENKNRKKPQRSDAVETENMINIADDTEIIDLTKKVVDKSANGGKKEEEGGLITTWKEI